MLRKLFIVASTCTSLIVLYVFGMLSLALSMRVHPFTAVLLFPWIFGALGVVGLIRSWTPPAEKSALRLRADIVLISLGIVGATIFAVLSVIFVVATAINGARSELAIAFAFAAFFPLMPIALACMEIHASWLLMRTKPRPDAVKMRKLYLLLFLLPVAIVGARIVAQEVVMVWYGHDLVSAAYASANDIAKGDHWCVIDHDGADTFEGMNKRKILLQAFQNRLGFHGGASIDPYFGIAVNQETFWWSFKQQKFLPLYPFQWDALLPSQRCE